jgi:GNAT superfamily N-acetyltransferase
MNAKEILSLYDLEMRVDPPSWGIEVHRQPGLTFVATSMPSTHSGWVIYTDLEEGTADNTIRSVTEFFEKRGQKFEWKLYDHDQPRDLKQRLLSRGFEPDEMESLLAFDLESAPEQFWKPLPEGIRHITDPGDLKLIFEVQSEVWQRSFDDLAEALRFEMKENPAGISIYMAEVDGRPVSAAWVRFHENRRFGELFGGSTLEAYRGRGIYSSLVLARAWEARNRGIRFLTVDTSPMSRPILEKLGFVFLTQSQPFTFSSQWNA